MNLPRRASFRDGMYQKPQTLILDCTWEVLLFQKAGYSCQLLFCKSEWILAACSAGSGHLFHGRKISWFNRQTHARESSPGASSVSFGLFIVLGLTSVLMKAKKKQVIELADVKKMKGSSSEERRIWVRVKTTLSGCRRESREWGCELKVAKDLT